jgi:hypothetical protein
MQYNNVRAALLALRGPGDWETTLPVLRPEDVRGINERSMTEEEKQDGIRARQMAGLSVDGEIEDMDGTPVVPFDPRLTLGEGRRTLSWIWYSVSEGEMNGGSAEVEASKWSTPSAKASLIDRAVGLRVEWAKQYARAARWREELLLLEEEMCRSIAFSLWHAQWWRNRASGLDGVPGHVAEGLCAYAVEQSDAEERRVMNWTAKWTAVRQRAKTIVSTNLSNFESLRLPNLEVELEDEDEDREGDSAEGDDDEGT